MIGRLSCLMAIIAGLAATAGAADLKVISAGAVRGLIAQIIDDFSRQTGKSSTSPSAPPVNCATSSRRACRPTSSSSLRR